MAKQWLIFLLLAAAIGLVTFAAVGGFLLPRLGVEGTLVQAICGGIAGMAIALLYLRMFKRPDRA